MKKNNLSLLLYAHKEKLYGLKLLFIFLFGTILGVSAQESLKITGKVIDNIGEPLIGVTIVEKGTNNATITDVNGNFSLYNVASDSSIIRFTYIGFLAFESRIPHDRIISATLMPDNMGLEEVVIVGYGSQKKESVVGAISSIKPKTLESGQTRSITNNLAGQIAGVIAVQRSGEPGYDNSDFWIRGINTFGTNSTPLVLVDGIERSLSNIMPEEIESFSILKDASATAIYGVRGANGVILIETKKGKEGKPSISVKTNFGITNPTKLPEFVDGAKYMEIVNEARELSGLQASFTDEAIENTRTGVDPDLYPDVDWLNELTKSNAKNSKVSVDINGGSDRLRYSLVVGYYGEEGITIDDPGTNYNSEIKLKRYNVRSNVDLDLTSSTVVNVGIGGYVMDRNAPGTGIDEIMDRIFEATPIMHPKIYSNGQIPKYGDRRNPWALMTQTGYSTQYQSSFQSNVSVTQDMGKIISGLKGLKLKGMFSYDFWNWNNVDRTKSPTYYWASGRDDNGDLITSIVSEGQEFLDFSKSAGGNKTSYLEFQANYKRRFNSHTLEGLFLFNRREYVNGDATSAIMSIPYRNQGIAGRVSYNYADRYFTEFNFGYNGSENFKKGKRYGFFPSVALGWMISNENFMQGAQDVLSELKIRGSLGTVGNDNISDTRRFGYLATISEVTGYNFGYLGQYYSTGYQEGDFGVDNLTWESATKANIGLELGLFSSISIQADYFKEWREDIFMQRETIPETAGYSEAPYANYGKVENHGFEVSLEYNKAITDDLFLTLKGNYTFARNKITECDEAESLKNTTRAETGHPLNQHFGLIAEGLFTPDDFDSEGNLVDGIPVHSFGTVQAGDIRYADINNDGTVDSYDQKAIGAPWTPEIVYGFAFNLRYKNLDLGALFQGVDNMTNMLTGETLLPASGGGAKGGIYANVDNRWSADDPYNGDVFWPRLAITKSENNSQVSTWWLKNSSYLRLKNLEVGYTLPKAWQKACYMRHARVFFRGTNLFTIADFDMWDPELGSSNGLSYPTQKVYSCGLEVSF